MCICFCWFGIILWVILNPLLHAHEYHVKLSNNGPIVFGASITFTAELRSDDKIPNGEEFTYKWRDNLFPQNKAEFQSNGTSTWTVCYSADRYHRAGIYWVEVSVYTKTFIIDWPLCGKQQKFEITHKLNGNLTFVQNGVPNSNSYISNSSEVVHEIVLTEPDFQYIKQNSSSISVFWYIDCDPIAVTNDLVYHHNYTQPEVSHVIHAFVVVTNRPPSNSSRNDSRPVANVSIIHENSSGIVNSLDVLVNTNSDSPNKTKFSYELLDKDTFGGTFFDCKMDMVSVVENTSTTYGLFSQKMRVLAPVENVTATGNQWIQHSDMLNLTITCRGSPPFRTCFRVKPGYYNATGNETCGFEDVLEKCEFSVPHYFLDSSHYSVLLIIRNDINKIVRSIGIDVYEVTKHPQLSVIVVPISAAIVAVVLIIFGIAYYIQSRNRFMIEVADFDFSTNASDMEYKTFRERLVEAFHNAFDKPEDFYEQDSTNTAPTNKKYGSMS